MIKMLQTGSLVKADDQTRAVVFGLRKPSVVGGIIAAPLPHHGRLKPFAEITPQFIGFFSPHSPTFDYNSVVTQVFLGLVNDIPRRRAYLHHALLFLFFQSQPFVTLYCEHHGN